MTCALIDRPHIIPSPLNIQYTSQRMKTVDERGADSDTVPKVQDDRDTSCSETESEYSENTECTSLDLQMQELKDYRNQGDKIETLDLHEESVGCNLTDTDLETAKKRLRLVMAYAQLKEEMEKSTSRNIAALLYQHKDKLLSGPAHENIHASRTRSESAERLLKRVLMGPDNVHEVFVQLLRQEDESLAVKIDRIVLTDYDLKVFLAMERKAESNRSKQYKNKFTRAFMKRHRRILEHWLNDKVVVDSINDQFLSRLIFGIGEHTDIADNSKDTKNKLKLLLSTIENCQHDIRDVFVEILKLDTVGMTHIVDRLSKRNSVSRQNEKRKSDESLFATPPKRKSIRNNLCSDKEANIVKTLQSSKGANVKDKLSELDLEYEETCEGSIIIQLVPKSSVSLHKLKHSCRTGAIKDFVPEVYRNNISDFEEGEYLLSFKIFLLPTPPYSQNDKKIIFHLEIEESTSIDINECQQLLCQELEITDTLITQLKDEGIVGDNIKHVISKLPRRKRIKYVLDEISSYGVRGYNKLKDYIKTADEYLYKDLITKEETMKMDKEMRLRTRVDARCTSASQENKKELFYTASLLLDVKKAAIDNKTRTRDKAKDEISCKKVIFSKCHFTDEVTDKTCEIDSGKQLHSLDEHWKIDDIPEGKKDTVQELAGKRKVSDSQCEEPDEKSLQRALKKGHNKYSDADKTLLVVPRMDIGRSHKETSSKKGAIFNNPFFPL